MATIDIDLTTFIATGPANHYSAQFPHLYDEPGTVQVLIGRKIVVAAARRDHRGTVSVGGFVGRYVKSTKPWRAVVSKQPGTGLFVHFGRDDRSGRFHKQNAISWEPELYAQL